MLKKPFSKNVEVIGFENLTYSGATVFVANHVSEKDIPLLHTILPDDVHFAINSENKADYQDVTRTRKHIIYDVLDSKTLLPFKKLLEEKQAVLIFPETRQSISGAIAKVYEEITKIIQEMEATIFPITISGSENKLIHPDQKIKIKLRSPFIMEKATNSALTIVEKLQEGIFNIRQKQKVNLFNELVEASKIFGEKKLIAEDMNQKMTYRDLILASHVFSYKLDTLLQGNKVVGTFLPTTVGYTLTLFALFKLGKTPAALNFTMGEQTLLDCLENASVKVIITSKEFVNKGGFEDVIGALSLHVKILYLEDIKPTVTTGDKLKALSEYKLGKKVEQKNNEIVLFTSGSENKPKGVILTHDNIYSNIHQALSTIEITTQEKMLNSLPMFHSFGLTGGTFLPILAGIPVFLYPAPTHYKVIPEIVYRSGATVILGTSTFYGMYAKNAHPFDFQKIRYALAGAEKLKDEVFDIWNEKFGVRILEGYGVTETTPILSLNTPLMYKRGTVGRLLPGIEYKIEPVEGIEEGGSLVVKGPNVMRGYLIHGKGFIPNEGWHDTGDIVTIDEEGFVSVIGRKKRFAKIGGEMVSLNFVEKLASDCFGSPDFAATAVPDKRKGEIIVLFTIEEGATLKKLKEYYKDQKQPALYLPKHIQYIEELPLLGTGKTDYVTIEKMAKEFVENLD